MLGGTFGGWVSAARRALGLAQSELAAEAGCTVSMLKKIEAGGRTPSSQLRARLESVLAEAPGVEPMTSLRGDRLVSVVVSDPSDDDIATADWVFVDSREDLHVRVAPTLQQALVFARSRTSTVAVHVGIGHIEVIAKKATELFDHGTGIVCPRQLLRLSEM